MCIDGDGCIRGFRGDFAVADAILSHRIEIEVTIAAELDAKFETGEFEKTIDEKLIELLDHKKGLVAESGIKSRADVEKLKSVGVSAVLVGQTLCESQSIEDKFKELFG